MPHEPQLGMFPPRKEYGVMELWELSFSSDWNKGGWIIEREEISIESGVEWTAYCWIDKKDEQAYGNGKTPLEAAMRCYVASVLGDEVELPDEVTNV